VGLKTPRVFHNKGTKTMFGQIQHLTAQFHDGELTHNEYASHVARLLLEADEDNLVQFARAVELVQA